MELYRDILISALSNEKMQVIFPDMEVDPAQIVEGRCYLALQKIKAIRHYPQKEVPCYLLRRISSPYGP